MKKLIFILLILLFFNQSCQNNYLSTSNKNSDNEQITVIENNEYCLIDLKGEVLHPNLYQIKAGSTLYELIEMAGGLTKEADEQNINFVSLITNNQMITIPKKKDNNITNNKININNCSKEDLLSLPGIGYAKADSIIEYRNQNGRFSNIEDIKKVSGIGEELFNRIKNEITV